MSAHTGWVEDQVVAVTGGGSGLGRALVEGLVEEGARVVVLERSPSKAEALRADFGPERVRAVEGDATLLADNRATVAAALDAFGRLDCFVANAGLWDFSARLADLPDDAISAAFDEVYALNVKAPLLGAKAALDALRTTNGSLVVTLSNAALYPGGGGSLYVSSKHAGLGLVRQLAWELAPDVRVNAVAPGGMSTDLRGPAALDYADTPLSSLPMDDIMEKHGPLRRAPKPQDYVGAFLLLASRRYGAMSTGTIVDVAAGRGIALSLHEN
ncbi:3-(cis-5,6-dihydroxycyclohexa-1,3-dien-1-yl)propanoate dehydrogenase [Streptomyces sp. NPDC002845]